MRKLLPNAKQMLHQQAHSRDTNPAAKPHKDRFSSGFHKLDDVGVQADCRHCHDNKEFAHLFQRACHRGRKVENGGNHGSKQKKQHKEGENLFQIDFCALCAMPFPAGAHKREHQCDRDDRKRACQFDDRRRVERVAAVDTIPSLCCGRYGGSVVDRRAGK